MEDKIKCLMCPNGFIPRTYRHKYCCRRCFKKHEKRESKRSRFPFYVCQVCGFKIQLGFFPIQNTERLKNTVCPKCGGKQQPTDDGRLCSDKIFDGFKAPELR